MTSINTEENEIKFRIESLSNLRKNFLSVKQQTILDKAWNKHYEIETPLTYRELGKLCGTTEVQEVIGWMDPALLREDESKGNKEFQLNIYGALLSEQGEFLGGLMVMFLDYIKRRYSEDENVEEIKSEEVQTDMSFLDSDLKSLFRFLRLYGFNRLPFWLGGWSKDGWQIKISDFVVHLHQQEDTTTYLNGLLGTVQMRTGPKPNPMPFPWPHSVQDFETNTTALPKAPRPINPLFISNETINDLIAINSDKWDLSKLIQLCKELNDNYQNENVYAIAILTRVIIDHIPEIFGCKTFKEVAAGYSGDGISFRKSAGRLEKHVRNLADNSLHSPVRKKERLPTLSTVSYPGEVEAILSEVCRILK